MLLSAFIHPHLCKENHGILHPCIQNILRSNEPTKNLLQVDPDDSISLEDCAKLRRLFIHLTDSTNTNNTSETTLTQIRTDRPRHLRFLPIKYKDVMTDTLPLSTDDETSCSEALLCFLLSQGCIGTSIFAFILSALPNNKQQLSFHHSLFYMFFLRLKIFHQTSDRWQMFMLSALLSLAIKHSDFDLQPSFQSNTVTLFLQNIMEIIAIDLQMLFLNPTSEHFELSQKNLENKVNTNINELEDILKLSQQKDLQLLKDLYIDTLKDIRGEMDKANFAFQVLTLICETQEMMDVFERSSNNFLKSIYSFNHNDDGENQLNFTNTQRKLLISLSIFDFGRICMPNQLHFLSTAVQCSLDYIQMKDLFKAHQVFFIYFSSLIILTHHLSY